jgi:Tol biopolymer transport system component
MADQRTTVERELDKVQVRPFTVDEFHRRRERKHRNQRIRAGVVAMVIAVGGTGVAVRAFQAEPSPQPSSGRSVVPSPATAGAPIHVRDGSIAFVDSTAAGGSRVLVYEPRSGTTRTLVNLGCTAATGCSGEYVSGIAWSPDGSLLAYSLQRTSGSAGSSSSTTSGPGISVLDLRTGLSHRISTCGTATCGSDGTLAWSPNGETIAFTRTLGSSTAIWTMSADGSNPQPLDTGLTSSADPNFLPDGTTILYVGPDGLYTTTLASHTTQKIDVGSGPNPAELIGPAYSPSGKQIAFVERTCGPAGRLWISQVGSGTAQKVQIGPRCVGFFETAPAWSPDSVEIAVAVSGSIDLVKADGTNVQTLTQGSGFPAWYPSR